MSRLPVVAVSGHLGAGKTSLLNHLLRTPGARIGVVVNDFGALNVDAGLVSGQVDDVAGIAGGCVCCLDDAGGLDAALAKLAQERLRLDAIVIEASGAADPPALARLIRYSGVERVRPGGLIEVVDAVEHFRTVDTRPEPPARYGVATLVVVGKLDLVPPAKREAVFDRIARRVRSRNPSVAVVAARRGAIDPALAFDVLNHEDAPDELPIGRLLRDDVSAASGHAHEHALSASVVLREAVDPGVLVDLLEEPPNGAYRMKGRVRVVGARREQSFVVHVVGPMIHVAPLPEAPTSGELVAIGMNLDEASAQARLEAVAASGSGKPDAAGLRRLHRYRRLSD